VRALLRLAAIAVAGAALYFAGIVNSIILEHPERPGAPAVVVGIGGALALMLFALRGTGRDDARTTTDRVWFFRGTWLFVCVMALVGISWLGSVPRQHSFDWTPYHNDAIALNQCAAQLVLAGRDPYTDLDLFACYGQLGIGPDRTTPLRRGLFANDVVYPTDQEMDDAWGLRSTGVGTNVEFVWRPSYPALSFLLLLPVVAAGIDTNYLYLACLLVGIALVVWRAPSSLRPFFLTALLGAASLIAFTVGGSSDLLYALPLLIAWIWRDRPWAAVALGLAVATKQIAWFFVPYYAVAVLAERGRRAVVRDLAIAAGIFALANAPFIAHDPAAWALGVLTPLVEPMFPRGAGIVFLSTNGGLALPPSIVYAVLEGLAAAISLAVAWRTRRTSPELGVVLAVVPLFFAWRSLFSYFFLLPLFACGAVARMPLGELVAARAKRLGALTIFATSSRT
jgi:hypothetical protein